MKKINKISKFKSLYYIGLSVIIGIAFVVFLFLSIISGVIIKSFNHQDENKTVEQVEDTQNVKEIPKKVLVYDTVVVQVYDTIKPKVKKIKPVTIKPETPDSLK